MCGIRRKVFIFGKENILKGEEKHSISSSSFHHSRVFECDVAFIHLLQPLKLHPFEVCSCTIFVLFVWCGWFTFNHQIKYNWRCYSNDEMYHREWCGWCRECISVVYIFLFCHIIFF